MILVKFVSEVCVTGVNDPGGESSRGRNDKGAKKPDTFSCHSQAHVIPAETERHVIWQPVKRKFKFSSCFSQ